VITDVDVVVTVPITDDARITIPITDDAGVPIPIAAGRIRTRWIGTCGRQPESQQEQQESIEILKRQCNESAAHACFTPLRNPERKLRHPLSLGGRSVELAKMRYLGAILVCRWNEEWHDCIHMRTLEFSLE
jgi:hypothetical protein